ncbi:hypothetical protein PCE1_002011 [Barthelona sp. PCE]
MSLTNQHFCDSILKDLRRLCFPEDGFRVSQLQTAHPAVLIQILHHTFLGFSRYLPEYIEKSNSVNIRLDDDIIFTKDCFQTAERLFGYRPLMTAEQFLDLNESDTDSKLRIVNDLIKLAKKKHNELYRDQHRGAQPMHNLPHSQIAKVAHEQMLSTLSKNEHRRKGDFNSLYTLYDELNQRILALESEQTRMTTNFEENQVKILEKLDELSKQHNDVTEKHDRVKRTEGPMDISHITEPTPIVERKNLNGSGGLHALDFDNLPANRLDYLLTVAQNARERQEDLKKTLSVLMTDNNH